MDFVILMQQGFFSSILIFLDICAVPAASLHITTVTPLVSFFTLALVLAGAWEVQVGLGATQALLLAVLILVVSWA